MAISKCGNCGGGKFEVVEKSPIGSNIKQMFTQCISCGVPVGTWDSSEAYARIKKLEERIEKIESGISAINSTLSVIDHNLRVIAKRIL